MQPAPLDPAPDDAALRRALGAVLPGIVVERVAETGSTNSDLLERARDEYERQSLDELVAS